MSQGRLARLAGISKRTLERIESDRDGSVKVWHLVNLALVLKCELYELLEDEWLEYRQTNVGVPPPDPNALPRPEGERLPRHGRERVRRRQSSR